MKSGAATDLEHGLAALLYQSAHAIARARDNEVRQQAGISRMQGAILFMLDMMDEAPTPAAIGRLLLQEPHSASGLLSRMERDGLVRRVKDGQKKNLVRILMTDKGREAHNKSRESHSLHNIFSGLSDKQQKTLVQYLRILRRKALEEVRINNEMLFPR